MCESVLTHTSPCPPPGAGVALVAASALTLFAEAGFAAAGLADADVFGLNKSASVFFAGDGDGVTVGATAAVVFLLRACFSAGEGDAAVAAAGEGEVAAAAVASAFLCARCFAGEGDSAGEPLGVGD
jgi:hypothetical protein